MQHNRILFRLRVQLVALVGLLVFLLIILGAVLWGVRYLEQTIFSQGGLSDARDRSELQELDALFMETSEDARRVGYLMEQQYRYTSTMDILVGVKNEGVYLESLSLEGNKGTIVALAQQRDDALQFERLLKQEECFQEVTIPIEDLVRRDRLRFSLSFLLDRSCLE